MTEGEDPSDRADPKVRRRQLAGPYIEYFLENGLDLYYYEPTPVLEDYLLWHKNNPPYHLRLADEAIRLQLGEEAWEHAVVDRQRRIARAKGDFILLHDLITRRMMLDVAYKAGNWSPEEFKGWLIKAREHIVEDLWLASKWREPWIFFVNQEFPGPEPTSDDLERFELKRPELERDDASSRLQQKQARAEMEAFLVEHGYVPEPEEVMLVALLSSLFLIWCIRPIVKGDEIGQEFRQLIQEAAVNPDHPAWKDLIEEYSARLREISAKES